MTEQEIVAKLIDVEGELNELVVQMNGITATGADGPTVEAMMLKLKDQVSVIHGITATGAD